MEWARVQSLSLVRQLRTLEIHRSTHPDQGDILTQTCAKVRDQVLKLNEMSRRLVSRIDANEEAAVTVWGTVFPGTSIDICHVVRQVLRPLKAVKFILDKNRGEIREVRI
jgi:uncharacterized protein (DUF342 family)